jgi:hypothetical protein
MGIFAGNTNSWWNQTGGTDSSRIYIATNKVVQSGLVLNLDAGASTSYPGSGTTWTDLSGGGRNYTMSGDISWNPAGYFSCTNGVFTGPASNSFGFSSSNEHTIEVIAQVSAAASGTIFNWYASPISGSAQRGIFSHLYLGAGTTFYDVSGCCDANQRISYSGGSDVLANIKHFVWRTRTSAKPNRQFFKNTVGQMDSGANDTYPAIWNLNYPATIADTFAGKLYSVRAYNRALTDAEVSQNFNALRSRYGI